MDEEKRKYLEELKKQIDPEILSKMANYLGSSGDGDVVSTGGGSGLGATTALSGSSGSAADMIRERRAMQFQERVARRKRENIVEQIVEKEPVEQKNILIFASNDLWSRIVENQFRNIGFTGSQTFTDFSSLIKYLLEWSNEENPNKLAVGVAFQDLGSFLHAWEHLRRESEQQPQFKFLHNICYFIVVEYLKQIQEALVDRLGHDRIICITDEVDDNREKVERSMIAGNLRSE